MPYIYNKISRYLPKDLRETSKDLEIKTKQLFSKEPLAENIKPIC